MVNTAVTLFVPERQTYARVMEGMASFASALAKAVRSGRDPATREARLLALLQKRGAAYRAGMVRQEEVLRDQILRGLPVRRGEDA